MVIGDPSFTSLLVSVVGMMSKERGWGFYEKLRANDTMVVQGNQQASDMLKRGERLIAVGALDSYAAEDRAAGHPMKTLYPSDGVFVIPSPTSVVKGSPSPNAAKLFAEFMISDEVQKIFPADGGFAARSDIAAPAGSPPLSSLKILPVDYDYIEKEAPRIKRRFNEIFPVEFCDGPRRGHPSPFAGGWTRAIASDGWGERSCNARPPHPTALGYRLRSTTLPETGRDSAYAAPPPIIHVQLVAGVGLCSVSSSICTGPRPPSRRCSRSSSR